MPTLDPSITLADISTVSHLDRFHNQLTAYQGVGPKRTYAYRGQSQTHGSLVPSFNRRLKDATESIARLIESDLVQTFRVGYERLAYREPGLPEPSDIGPENNFKCLSLMQHYEVPTRLLDWTTNFWIAAYFACASEHAEDGELWFYDRAIFGLRGPAEASLLRNPQNYRVPDPPELSMYQGKSILIEVEQQAGNRMKEQEGLHTYNLNIVDADHATHLLDLAKTAEQLGQPGPHFGRIIISKNIKPKILGYLSDVLDLNATRVFPDLVGLSRYLRWKYDGMRVEYCEA